MSFDISTAKWVMWGAKHPYNTFGHIHEAFLRALQFLGKEVSWLDRGDPLWHIDFSNTLFLSMDCVLDGMPRRKDCMYAIHNGNNPACSDFLAGLNWFTYGVHVSANRYDAAEIEHQCYFDKAHRVLVFRWGTDLLPHEIEANKPTRPFNADSRVVNYVGTLDSSNRHLIDRFISACRENGIGFEYCGGHSGKPVVGHDEHVRLIKASYMAPAIQRLDQVAQGYAPCRLFKNISYGQFGMTHSSYMNELFGGRLIYHSDPYHLFHEARERFKSLRLEELHGLMDEVATKHTYLNKINAIVAAAQALSE